MRRWNKEEEEISINLLKDGKTYEEIGLILKRSPNSIRTKLQKIGFRYVDFQEFYDNRICLECNENFICKRYDVKKFCNSSCSGSYTNRKSKLKHGKYATKSKNKKNCINCKKVIEKQKHTVKKFCNSTCRIEYNNNLLYNKMEENKCELKDSKKYKEYLILKHGDKCMRCGWCEINKITKKVPIQLEHKDGNSKNNNIDNLELLCPNCHSLTETYGSLNKGNGRSDRRNYRESLKKLTIQELIIEKQKIENK